MYPSLSYLVHPFSHWLLHPLLEMSQRHEALGLASYGNIVPTSTSTDAFLVSSKSARAEPANVSIEGQLISILGFASYVVSLCDSHSTPPWQSQTSGNWHGCVSIKLDLWTLKFEFCTLFKCCRILLLFWFFSQPFQNVNTVCNLGAVQNLAWGQTKPKGEQFANHCPKHTTYQPQKTADGFWYSWPLLPGKAVKLMILVIPFT